eukprot:GEMP01084648.1.p1 GENE.GEMP01084648.1~~GEMP01084648.1.p1  ORF type:complete len:101 (-),score=1.73 GEMP01084648.1:540-842(-)
MPRAPSTNLEEAKIVHNKCHLLANFISLKIQSIDKLFFVLRISFFFQREKYGIQKTKNKFLTRLYNTGNYVFLFIGIRKQHTRNPLGGKGEVSYRSMFWI